MLGSESAPHPPGSFSVTWLVWSTLSSTWRRGPSTEAFALALKPPRMSHSPPKKRKKGHNIGFQAPISFQLAWVIKMHRYTGSVGVGWSIGEKRSTNDVEVARTSRQSG